MDMLYLLGAGILAAACRFFINYIEIEYEMKKLRSMGFDIVARAGSEIKPMVAIVGYATLGISGALLTPFAMKLLSIPPEEGWILFGYAFLFGFFVVRLLNKLYVIITPPKST